MVKEFIISNGKCANHQNLIPWTDVEQLPVTSANPVCFTQLEIKIIIFLRDF